jgi:hypothetical protein
MTLIQCFLILFCVCFLALYFAYFRSLLRDRIAAVVLCSSAIFFVLFPDMSTPIANTLGVGRGADLVIYLAITSGAFVFILTWSKLLSLQKMQTDIVRELAIRDARKRD